MRTILSSLITIFGLLITLNGCSADPVSTQEQHFEAEGIVFLQSGIIIAEIFRGVTSDTLYAPLGDMTAGIDVKFYNSNKQEMDPPDNEENTFSWEID